MLLASATTATASSIPPTTIPQLRQAIPQLALQCQLVPQDPNDELASVSLAKIKSERERRSESGEIPHQRVVPPVTQAEYPFELPGGGESARFGDLCLSIEAGWSPKCEERPRIGDEWGIIKISAVTWRQFNPHENKTLRVFPKSVDRKYVNLFNNGSIAREHYMRAAAVHHLLNHSVEAVS